MIITHTNSQEKITAESGEDEQLLVSLRAQEWKEFFGQKKLIQAIMMAITSSQKRQETLEHALFYGPPGLGKTTLAHLIGRTLGKNVRVTSGPAIERSGDLAAILTNLSAGDVLFIDEIHRLNRVVEEILYPAMEDYALDVVLGKGPSAKTVRIDLPPFTLIGATTRIGMISAPLRDRFGLIWRLEQYSHSDLTAIICAAGKKLRCELDEAIAYEIAIRSRATPRIALTLLKRVRDVSIVKNETKVSSQSLSQALELLEIDQLGLTEFDRKMLLSIIELHEGGPVGLETIAAIINEDIATVELVLEPYLIQSGLLKRTPRGRMVTQKAYSHLKK